MKKIFINNFKHFDQTKYLNKMIQATFDSQIIIARKTDDNGMSCQTVDNLEDANALSTITINWCKDDVDTVLTVYNNILQEIDKTTDCDKLDITKFLKRDFRQAQVQNSAKQLAIFKQLNAPKFIIEDYKCCLLEDVAINLFATEYNHQKATREEIEKILHKFDIDEQNAKNNVELQKFLPDILSFVANNNRFTCDDLDDEIMCSYSTVLYAIRCLLHNNYIVQEDEDSDYYITTNNGNKNFEIINYIDDKMLAYDDMSFEELAEELQQKIDECMGR